MRRKVSGTLKPRNSRHITLGSISHVGVKRSSNQDRCSVLRAPDAPLGADALLVVADGMGGYLAGDVAAEIAIRELIQRLSQWGSDGTLLQPEDFLRRLDGAVRQANAAVHKASNGPGRRGMGTTLTVALLVGPNVVLAHVGDSRAYLLRKGCLRQMTRDHSWVAEQVAAGALSPEEAQHHPKRSVLTRALGPAPTVRADGMSVKLKGGDILLLCSDGLHTLVTEKEMSRVLARQDPPKASQSLVERANALGGHDNITVVVARVDTLGSKVARGILRLPLSLLWLPLRVVARLAQTLRRPRT